MRTSPLPRRSRAATSRLSLASVAALSSDLTVLLHTL
jgi:hypothetical protein